MRKRAELSLAAGNLIDLFTTMPSGARLKNFFESIYVIKFPSKSARSNKLEFTSCNSISRIQGKSTGLFRFLEMTVRLRLTFL